MVTRFFSVQSAAVLSLFFVMNLQSLTAADIDFSHDIVPVLKTHCGECHTGAKKQGGLSFNTREALLAGGESGKAVVPGKSSESELLKRVLSSDSDLRMPPEGPRVPADKIALLKQWIEEGAKWEDGFSFAGAAWEPPLKPRRPELPAARDRRTNPVDRIVDAYLAERRIPPQKAVADAAFYRRLSLDIVGLLPDSEDLQKFVADEASDKRSKLIDKLLTDDVAYAEHWLTFWNDLLRNDYAGTGFITGGRKQITGWLYRSLVDNKPFDVMVRELIVASPESEGFIQGIRWRGNVSASQTNEVQFAQSISQSFLGINMKCASCHDSFIDHWKLKDAYGLAAIYATQPLEVHRCDKPTGEKAVPRWLFPELGQINPEAPQPERMKQLAALLTHPENGRVTRTIVNRLWHRLMGRGIVHPVDAMHTPPWSADLLDWLAVDFQDHQQDLKWTIRLICESQAYQAQTPPITTNPEGDSSVFRGPVARRMTAEQFVDSVWQMTGAAPQKADAQVIRAKITPPNNSQPATGGSKPASAELKLTGKWIWSYPEAASGKPAANETITVRKKFSLKELPRRSAAVITCDNSYNLFVNGRSVGSHDEWSDVRIYALDSYLKAGSNEIMIVAKNGGSGPNPAGLFFEARLSMKDDAEMIVATNADWEWTSEVPDARGRFKNEKAEWKSAAIIPNPEVWANSVNAPMTALLVAGTSGPQRMVRASLVKADELMRALGRPNRDQIVTMRPADLTTLEAINLANGQSLADAIARGATILLSGYGGNAEALIEHVYLAALSRKPTAAEAGAAREILGREPSASSIEDLLWAIFMLPEYQLVR